MQKRKFNFLNNQVSLSLFFFKVMHILENISSRNTDVRKKSDLQICLKGRVHDKLQTIYDTL